MKKWLLLAAVTLLMAGCGTYIPYCIDAPTVDHQGDLQADAVLYSVSGYGVIFHAGATVGITDHIGAQLYASNFQNWHYQGSAGWFTRVGDNGVAAIYGGFSYGEAGYASVKDPESISMVGTNRTAFLQGVWGWNGLHRPSAVKARHDVNFSLKAGFMQSPMSVDYYLREGGDFVLDANGDPVRCYDVPFTYHSLLLEPQLEWRYGWEHLKFSFKVALDLMGNVNKDPRPLKFYSFPAMIGLGVNYRL